MKGKLIGIGTIISLVVLCLLLIIIATGGEFFSAINVQLLMLVFTLTIVLSCSYLLNTYSPQTSPKIKMGIAGIGILLIVFSAFVSFNIVDVRATFNWLIALGLFYILFVQLQLMQWGNSPSILSKICSFIVIIADLFLIVFFIVQWRYSAISIIIDIAVLSSIVAFLIGVMANKKVVAPV